MKEHPVLKLIQAGVNVTLSTDNRTVSGVTQTDEIKLIHELWGVDKKTFKTIYQNSVEACFCSEEIKQKLRAHLSWFD